MDYNKLSNKNNGDLEQIKFINILRNIKSDYILQIIFDNLQKEKMLEILKYNKKMQIKLNLTIKDYKDFSEIYSPIEIELIPLENKYGNFINILNKEEESYFHIYFNDDKDEIKRTHLNEIDKVTKIKIIIDYQIKSFFQLFFRCKCIKSINFKKFHRNNINNLSCLFYGCSSLNELNIFNFKTDNVIDMSYMFAYCSALKELNISRFNTIKVINMSFMFYKCSSLKEIIISNGDFDNNIIYKSYIFFKSLSKKRMNFNNININNKSSNNFFTDNSSCLKEENNINLKNDNLINMSDMFFGCSNELIIQKKI